MIYSIYIQELRGLSIILIMLYHYIKYKMIDGYLSVSIFLQISGYVITSSSINNKNPNILSFYYRRIVAIFPKLYISIIFILYLNRKNSYNNILNIYSEISSIIKINSNYYFYKKEIDYFSQFNNPSFTLHLWYISLQQKIYIIYPILFVIYSKCTIFLIFLAMFSITTFSVSIYINTSFSYYLIVSRLYEFIIGMICTISIYINRSMNYLQNLVIYIIITIQLVNFKINKLFKFLVINSSCLVLLIVINASLLDRSFILNNIILYTIGNLSYELYLIHYPLIQLNLNNIFVTFACIFGISYLLSYLKYINKNFLFVSSFIFPIILTIYIYNTNRYYIKKYKNVIIAPKIDPNKEYIKILKIIKAFHPLNNKKKKILLLIGDSHLQQWFPSIIRIAKLKDYAIVHEYFHTDVIEMENFYKMIFFLKNNRNSKRIVISSFYIYHKVKNISYFHKHFSVT